MTIAKIWNPTTSQWEPAVIGAQGPTGLAGPTGPTGTQGTTGSTGPTGGTGPTGPTGPTGATGAGVAAGGTTGQVLTKTNATDYNTQWSTVYPPMLPMGAGRVYQPPYISSNGMANPTANRMFLLPMFVSKTLTATNLQVYTNTVTTSGSVRLGIYDTNYTTGEPGSLVVDGGTVAYSANNAVYSVTISASLTAGWYWTAAVVQSGNSTWLGTPNGANANTSYFTQRSHQSNSGNIVLGYFTDSVTGALPSAPSWTLTNSAIMMVKVTLA